MKYTTQNPPAPGQIVFVAAPRFGKYGQSMRPEGSYSMTFFDFRHYAYVAALMAGLVFSYDEEGEAEAEKAAKPDLSEWNFTPPTTNEQ